MSNSIDADLDLDLHFLPAWAKEPSNKNLYADFEGEPEERAKGRRGDRFERRREGPPPRDRQGPRPEREQRRFEPRGPRPPRAPGEPRPPRPPRGPGEPRGRGEFRRREEDGRRGRPGQEPRSFKPEPLPELRITFQPDEKGVDSLARQIKMTGRAYPLFDVAQMILAKPERYTVTLSVQRNAEGQPLQPLFVCALDESVWLSETEAMEYVLDKYFTTFYQAEKTAVEPPKGTYTFVAQCGMSGVILGPPNHHDYPNNLRKLHADRFARMPFEVFKSRVKIVRDEAVIKKWLESQSWRTEYTCLNMPEPLRLASRAEVEQHFRENHLPIIVKQVEAHTLTGAASRHLRCQPLFRLVRYGWEDQKRFPLQTATVLSQQFAARGLQFFKVNKNVTHVAVARPHYLDLELEPVSEGVRRIVTFINETPKATRRQLLEALAPIPPAPPVPPPVAPAPDAEAVPAAEVVPAAEAGPAAESASAPPAESAEAPPPPAPAPAPLGPSPEVTAIIGDLHWLIHQGHVIEYANGILETAKKPLPRPPRPPFERPAAPPAADEAAAPEPATSAEIPMEADAAPPPADALTETVETAAVAPAAPEEFAPAEPAYAAAAEEQVPAMSEDQPPLAEPGRSEPPATPA